MARVEFEVVQEFETSTFDVWNELIDWKAHEAWVPATKVELHDSEGTQPGAEFTAVTGYGPLAMPDRMRVTVCDWDSSTHSGECSVEKLGPVLLGTAGFTVAPKSDGGCSVVWREAVKVRYLPRPLAPVARSLGAAGFRLGMKRLAKKLDQR